MTRQTYHWRHVVERLSIPHFQFWELIEIGLLSPVGRDDHGQALFCPETIDRLATAEENARLKDALWWFEPEQHPRLVARRQQLVSANPDYPFDSAEQREWAHEAFLNSKLYGNLPTRHTRRAKRRMKKSEALATKVFEKPHRKKERFNFRRYRRDLFNLVWSKTLIRAAADRGCSEFTLRQRCRQYSIPMPTRGHFNHKNPKDRPRRPALPPYKKSKVTVVAPQRKNPPPPSPACAGIRGRALDPPLDWDGVGTLRSHPPDKLRKRSDSRPRHQRRGSEGGRRSRER